MNPLERRPAPVNVVFSPLDGGGRALEKVRMPAPSASAPTHVALIRGINVGRAKRIAMADLRALVEGLGYVGVQTLLNSGNVVFTVPGKGRGAAIAAGIEQAMVRQLGVSAAVFVLTAAELAAVVAENPLVDATANPSRLLVTILSKPAQRKRLLPLVTQDFAPEVLAVGSRAVYHFCPDGILESRLIAPFVRLLGDAGTSRNWATLTKINALLGGAPA